MASNALADSSYLFALFNTTDAQHHSARSVAEVYHINFVVPDVALTEVAFLFQRARGTSAVLGFLDALAIKQVRLQPVTFDTLRRAREIMGEYADSRLDFVDCCIMALAEQLNITQVCTFDRRDFSIFRPKHCDYLELLP